MVDLRKFRFTSLLLGVLLLAGCGGTNTTVIPSSGSLLPNAVVQLTPELAYSTQEVVAIGAAGVLLYYVYDPLAPNWSIKEKALNADTYYLSLRAKSFRVGGDGESYQIIKRRAQQLQREKNYRSYKIVDYTEGIESSTPLTHRVAEGTILLVRSEKPTTR